MQPKNESNRRMAQIQDRAQSDPAFRTQLQRDPHKALEEYFGPIDSDIEIRVVQDTEQTKYLHVPPPPPQGEISDYDLVTAQGGTTPLCASIIVSIISMYSVSVGATTNS
ncbi:MAG: hypothetical protein AB3N15_04100 [Paracoccaceae bacterium]